MDATRENGQWVITGCAGFIGSHLLERALADGRAVVGVDDLSSGTTANLESVRKSVGESAWSRFKFVRGDIRDDAVADEALTGATVVLHNAALGSVPRSLAEPALFHAVNVDGTYRFLEAARKHDVKRFVYASSSSVYGDDPTLPKIESRTGRALSPYAATKQVNELEAGVYARNYGLETVGLRYFNVFGPRQNPNGAYAAVIPRWTESLLSGKPVETYGDGSSSRDFCFVANVVDANFAAATTRDVRAFGKAFNVACGDRTTLKELAQYLKDGVEAMGRSTASEFRHLPPRGGDIPHSHADISQAKDILGYTPAVQVREGLTITVRWYAERS